MHYGGGSCYRQTGQLQTRLYRYRRRGQLRTMTKSAVAAQYPGSLSLLWLPFSGGASPLPWEPPFAVHHQKPPQSCLTFREAEGPVQIQTQKIRSAHRPVHLAHPVRQLCRLRVVVAGLQTTLLAVTVRCPVVAGQSLSWSRRHRPATSPRPWSCVRALVGPCPAACVGFCPSGPWLTVPSWPAA